eukprot:scaffold4433_cov122-Cylindrotheca_fusiformis.AAC.2
MISTFRSRVLKMKQRPFDPLPNYEQQGNKRRRVCPDVPRSTKEWAEMMNRIHYLSRNPSRPPPIPFGASELQSARRSLLRSPTTTTSTMVPAFLSQVLKMKERPFDPLPNYDQRASKRRRVCPDIPRSTKEWAEMMNRIHYLSRNPSRPRPIPFGASELQSARRSLLRSPTTTASTMIPTFLSQVLKMKESWFDPLPNYDQRANKRQRVCPDVPRSTKEWAEMMNRIHYQSWTPSSPPPIPFGASELQSARGLLIPPKFQEVTTSIASTDWDVDVVADFGDFEETTEEAMAAEIETAQREESTKRSRRRKAPSGRKQRPTRASARLASKGLGSGYTRSGRRFSLRLANIA